MRLLCLLILLCAFPPSEATEVGDDFRNLVAEDRRQEQKAIKALGGRQVQRDGLVLKLRAGGKTLRFVDRFDPQREAELLLYRWHGFQVQGRFHEVEVTSYEDTTWYWIERRTGRKTVFTDQPQLSPDARHVAVASGDELNEDPGLWLWSIETQGLHSRFKTTSNYFEIQSWESPRHLKLREWRYTAGECPQGSERTQSLRQDARGAWQLNLPEPAWTCIGTH